MIGESKTIEPKSTTVAVSEDEPQVTTTRSPAENAELLTTEIEVFPGRASSVRMEHPMVQDARVATQTVTEEVVANTPPISGAVSSTSNTTPPPTPVRFSVDLTTTTSEFVWSKRMSASPSATVPKVSPRSTVSPGVTSSSEPQLMLPNVLSWEASEPPKPSSPTPLSATAIEAVEALVDVVAVDVSLAVRLSVVPVLLEVVAVLVPVAVAVTVPVAVTTVVVPDVTLVVVPEAVEAVLVDVQEADVSVAGAVGAGVGTAVGAAVVGEDVGAAVGVAVVGTAVGALVGAPVGAREGAPVGDQVGDEVGAAVGAPVGAPVGARVGAPVGDLVGAPVDAAVGCAEGTVVGAGGMVAAVGAGEGVGHTPPYSGRSRAGAGNAWVKLLGGVTGDPMAVRVTYLCAG